MADTSESAAPATGAPTDVLMALYMGDRDKARALAATRTLSLCELAAFGDVAPVSEHIAAHPEDVRIYSSDGWTALHLAAYFGYASVVVRLLRAGASHAALSRNEQGNTALHAALAGRREMPVVTALLAGGSDSDAIDAQAYRPLHLAASRGDQGAVELLLACGATRDAKTNDGRTAADLAAAKSHPDVAEWLTK